MATEFVATTSSWSPYFLNDTPSSRRPWLFRKEYTTIDRILSDNAARTHFGERRHPEEFASAFLIKLVRGTWSVPRRNTTFAGRNAELGQIHARLAAQSMDDSLLQQHSGVAKLEVAGMAGIGKTSICTEYCYRYFPSYYGLVIWLSAQSSENVAAGYRQLMVDTTGLDVKDKDTDEVVAEVKARLFRSKVPWLLVFDNLEDRSILEKFVPHGGNGHVLVTTRLLHTGNVDFDDQTMMLGCLNPCESVELLCRSAGKQNMTGEENIKAANQLADQLGHLPLALGMAAAYMSRCDVDCLEYLARYSGSPGSRDHLGHEPVQNSLSLSLDAIRGENETAWEALRLLAWLGPDQITKPLLRSLLMARHKSLLLAEEEEKVALARANAILYIGWTGMASCALVIFGRQMVVSRRPGRIQAGVVVLSTLAGAAAVLQYARRQAHTVEEQGSRTASGDSLDSSHLSFSGVVFEQTDLIWTILKSYSLLVVKEGKGSMHRLLAQALRGPQIEEESRRNLQVCVEVVKKLWTFRPEQVDTWQTSAAVLEHAKSVISHVMEHPMSVTGLDVVTLSREAGVFSAMALNRFKEARVSLECSLSMLDGKVDVARTPLEEARAATLHELGRVFRYEGSYMKSEEALQNALEIRKNLFRTNVAARRGVASTLHELGVLEVKKHNLQGAASFLQQALNLRRSLESETPSGDIEAECASTLHQLAAVQVAKKNPSLDKAEQLLKEALGLNMQIGQRAATLKQLARVAIRRGDFEKAERSLAQALELYVELYGENTLHINVASVRFQQGALAYQREQLEQAWLHFSECLRARRHVYAYSQGNHLEVSTVLHELGCVALAQKRESKAREILMSEKEILEQLAETSSQQGERIYQARLTNSTWLRKCARERGDEQDARRILAERSELKRQCKSVKRKSSHNQIDKTALQRECLMCRLVARQFALSSKSADQTTSTRSEAKERLLVALDGLEHEIDQTLPSAMKEAGKEFHGAVSRCLVNHDDSQMSESRNCATILEACDDLRDALRHHGVQVNDMVQHKQRL